MVLPEVRLTDRLEEVKLLQKRHRPEEIVAKLQQVDVLISQVQAVAEAVRSIDLSQLSNFCWRKENGSLDIIRFCG